MFGSILGFFELGAIILAWTIVWNFIIKGFTGNHTDNAAATGLASIYHA